MTGAPEGHAADHPTSVKPEERSERARSQAVILAKAKKAYAEKYDQTEGPDARRAALKAFMKARNITAGGWATRAGTHPGSIYAFMEGKTASISLPVLNKLAAAEGVPVSDLLGTSAMPDSTPSCMMVADGSIIQTSDPDPTASYRAAIAAKDHGWIREGYVLYFSATPTKEPVGSLCVVSTEGEMKLREVRRGYGRGLVNLVSLIGGVEEDVKVGQCFKIAWIKAA